MRKQYVMPTTKVVQVQVFQLICLSVAMTGKSQDNDQALSRQANSIWDDDETDQNADHISQW